MEPKPAAPCAFCGIDTDEFHQTSLGGLYVHLDCWLELEELLLPRRKDRELMMGEVAITGTL